MLTGSFLHTRQSMERQLLAGDISSLPFPPRANREIHDINLPHSKELARLSIYGHSLKTRGVFRSCYSSYSLSSRQRGRPINKDNPCRSYSNISTRWCCAFRASLSFLYPERVRHIAQNLQTPLPPSNYVIVLFQHTTNSTTTTTTIILNGNTLQPFT